MTQRVLLHIGLPKTGTTYLQQILWDNRTTLAEYGVWLPGRNRREHLWAALECTGADVSRRSSRAPGTLARLCDQIERNDRPTAVLSHEFFCGASRAQAADLLQRLAPARVEVVVTARDAGSMLAAGWQELVKNGSAVSLAEAATREDGSEFSWQTWDLGGVLERWASLLPPDQVHVLPIPLPGSAPDQHWRNFADVIGAPMDVDLPEAAVNASLGAVQVELLRRVNPLLGAFKQRPVDRGEWIRGYLAETHLAGQDGERFGLPPDLAEQCAVRSRRAVELIESAGYHVVGDPSSLSPADATTSRRDPADVTDAELVEAAAGLVAGMLADVRELTEDTAHRETGPPTAPQAAGEAAMRTGRRVADRLGLRRLTRRD